MKITDNDRSHAAMTLQFMAKVRLDGAEVPQYVAVNNWLQSIISEPRPPAPVYRSHDNMIQNDDGDAPEHQN